MAEPVPATGYGPATWINWTHNWRKEDGDFLQYRGILRYADDATRPASPTIGQAAFVQATDTVSFWASTSEWVPFLSSRLLRLVTAGVSPSGTATFAHKDASGAGLVFSNTKVRSSIDFEASAGFLADTVSIKTAAGGGNRTSKLTTNPTSLVSDSPILAPTAVLNGAAGADALTLSAGNLRVGGSAVIVSSLTAGSVTAPNMYLSGTTQDGAAGAVARKAYVDTQVGTKLSTSGDDMTGSISFGARLGQHINLYSTAYGIGIQSSNLYFRSGSAYKFYIGGSHTDAATAATLSIDSNSIDVTGGLSVTGTASVNNVIYSGTRIHAGGNGAQVRLIDTSAGGYDTFIEYYGGGTGVTTSNPGTRHAYLGFPSSTSFMVQNEISGGTVQLRTTGAGDIDLVTGAGGEIAFYPNGVFQGKMYGENILWGKAASDVHNVGLEFQGAYGRILSTTDVAANLYCHHIGANDASGKAFIQFLRGTTTQLLSEIRQLTTTGVTIVNCTVSAPSDYRWKDDLGPITGALDRVMELQPKRLRWKDSGVEFEGFIAHEAQKVVPYLVVGEKDAVDEEGRIDGQSLDYGGETPLLTAALQELAARVIALESAA